MNFSNPDEILKILLDVSCDYDYLINFCDELKNNIKEFHKNYLKNIYPSSITQCILECYKIKNNFNSCFWCSSLKIDKNLIKNNEVPISFSRICQNGEFVSYELYNECQLKFFPKLQKENTKNSNNSNDNNDDNNNDNDDIKLRDDIIACVEKFSGYYGKQGIARILKGSKSLKENEFNMPTINSEFYGKYKNKTIGFISNIIDDLIQENIFYTKKGLFNRPMLCIDDKKIKKEQNKNESLSENTLKILKLIEQKKNIFITGHAGTGKSYILNQLKTIIKDLILTSTTGIAAVNIKGQTIHSWANVGICARPAQEVADKILKRPLVKKQIQEAKILALDEISMLDIKTFEYIDSVLRQVRDIDKPFGGIQVIFIGDFFQLPPVIKQEQNNEYFKNYCFQSQLWNEFDFQTILLTKNYRQNEANLIKALANMRVNRLETCDVELLKSRECTETPELGEILHIFATNYESEKYNKIKFQNIKSKEFVFEAIDGIYKGSKIIYKSENENQEAIFKRIDMVCNADKKIHFKIGARVMLLVNLDFNAGLINGSCGNVEEISEEYIKINFDNGASSNIERHNFEFYKNDTVIAFRKQFPLKLAYGITIHKSQGMSLDKLVVDCSKIFEKGQTYVALSRIKTINGLYLHNFSPDKVKVDENVINFYNNLNYV